MSELFNQVKKNHKFEYHIIEVPDSLGFNGSIIPANEHYLLVYRSTEETLASCFLDKKYKVIPKTYNKLFHNVNIDPRLLKHNNQYYMSTSYFGNGKHIERIELWPFHLEGFQMKFADNLPFNNIRDFPNYRKGPEKNWTIFENDNELYYVYSINPHRILKINLEKKDVRLVYEDSWNLPIRLKLNTALRGNCCPVKLPDGNYLSIFHNQEKNEKYYENFYIFKGTPPFEVLYITDSYFAPEDTAGFRTLRNKALTYFVLSMDIEGDLIRICGGINDTTLCIGHLSLKEVLSNMVPVKRYKMFL